MSFKLISWIAGNEITSTDSLQFDLITLEIATNEFSNDNKLGHGGFGDVYKVIRLYLMFS